MKDGLFIFVGPSCLLDIRLLRRPHNILVAQNVTVAREKTIYILVLRTLEI